MYKKLQKYKCPECNHVNPLMELLNTTVCLNCHSAIVEAVKNGYVIIDTETNPINIVEISLEEDNDNTEDATQ